jgi:hypothetical protein
MVKVLIVSFLVVCGLCVLPSFILFSNNVAYSDVYLDGEKIYSGRNTYFFYKQLGEVGNKYSVRLIEKSFWGFFWQKTINIHIGNDLIVNNKQEDV